MVHDSGLVPVIFMDEYPRAHKLGREDLGSKIKIHSPNMGDIDHSHLERCVPGFHPVVDGGDCSRHAEGDQDSEEEDHVIGFCLHKLPRLCGVGATW